MPDLESLLARLVDGRVRFVVVGGIAAVVHGVSLVTQDVDICCPFTVGNLLRLQDVLSQLHPVHRMTPARPPLRLTRANAGQWKNLYLDTDWGQLDCLGEVAGVGAYAEVKRNSKRVALAGRTCHILGIDALIKAKESASRPRDREAVLQLKAIRERLR